MSLRDPVARATYHHAYYLAHRDEMRAYEYRRAKTPAARASHQVALRRHHEKAPEQIRAKTIVSQAVRRGRLVRQPCELCGAERTFAHHAWGYAFEFALAVWWLCQDHHTGIHKALKASVA